MRLCVLTNLGISGSYRGIILPIVNGGGPIAMFLLRNYFRGLPPEIYESAKLNGAAELRIWAQIHMPLNIRALTYLGINGFIVGFMQWVLPLLTVQNDSMDNVPLGVHYLTTTTDIQWNIAGGRHGDQPDAGRRGVLLAAEVVPARPRRGRLEGLDSRQCQPPGIRRGRWES